MLQAFEPAFEQQPWRVFRRFLIFCSKGSDALERGWQRSQWRACLLGYSLSTMVWSVVSTVCRQEKLFVSAGSSMLCSLLGARGFCVVLFCGQRLRDGMHESGILA